MSSVDYQLLRERMVRDQLKARDIFDPRVLNAMSEIPRHLFVTEKYRHMAYQDSALPIGRDQIVSQPYVIALMTQSLQLSGHEVVLEVGTGSGYHTAILCALASEVHSVERDSDLANLASSRLSALGFNNAYFYNGDGSQGLLDMAPYDAIVVSAAAPSIPLPLRNQLAESGRLILPVGSRYSQHIEKVIRFNNTWRIERLTPVMFVPLVGRYGFSGESGDPLW